MKKLLQEYRLELIALLAALLGVFLLVEQLDIRATLWGLLSRAGYGLAGLAGSLLDGLAAYLLSFTLSDFVGWMLLFSVGVFLTWRVRYHFLCSERWLATTCPRCGSKIHRVHRFGLDRFVTRVLLPKGRRYLCSNSDCRWSGLRRRGVARRQELMGEEQLTSKEET